MCHGNPFVLSAIIVFVVTGIVMVVVSFFTEKVPRERLGGLTWSTINEPPLNHGDIGEMDEGGGDGEKHGDDFPMLENGGKTGESSFIHPRPRVKILVNQLLKARLHMRFFMRFRCDFSYKTCPSLPFTGFQSRNAAAIYRQVSRS